jgi:hypothetical protein
MGRLIGIRVCGMQVEVLFYPVRKNLRAWEVEELSSLAVYLVFGPYQR